MAHIIKDDVAYPLIVQQPSAPVSEKLSYLTDIMEAVDGSESRVPLRQNARIEYEYTYPVFYKDDPLLYNTFYGALRKKFYVPAWHQAVRLRNDALVGSTTVHISHNASTVEIQDGTVVMLWTSPSSFFILDELTVGGSADELLFTNALPRTFDSSTTYVIPVRLAYVTSNVQKQTAGVSTGWTMGFEVLDEITIAEDTPQTYDGLDLYLQEVEQDGSAVSTTFNTDIDRVDFSIGKFEKRTMWKNTRTSVNHGFTMASVDEVHALKKRFRRHYGRNRPFYTSSRSVNLRVKSIVNSTTVLIEADDYGYYQQHKKVVFYMLDGTYFIVEVASVAPFDSTTITMTFSGPISQDLASIYYIAYLGKHRLDSDTLEIKYQSGGVSTATTRIIELEP